jgi:hypothetical protein
MNDLIHDDLQHSKCGLSSRSAINLRRPAIAIMEIHGLAPHSPTNKERFPRSQTGQSQLEAR